MLADGAGGAGDFDRAIVIGLGPRLPGLGGLQRRHVGPQRGHLIVDLFDGVLELESIGAGLGHQSPNLVFSHFQIRSGGGHHGLLQIDLNLVGLLIEFDKHIPFANPVVIVDQNFGHLARHAGRDEGDVAVHVSVVGRDREQRADKQRRHEKQEQHRGDA